METHLLYFQIWNWHSLYSLCIQFQNIKHAQWIHALNAIHDIHFFFSHSSCLCIYFGKCNYIFKECLLLTGKNGIKMVFNIWSKRAQSAPENLNVPVAQLGTELWHNCGEPIYSHPQNSRKVFESRLIDGFRQCLDTALKQNRKTVKFRSFQLIGPRVRTS